MADIFDELVPDGGQTTAPTPTKRDVFDELVPDEAPTGVKPLSKQEEQQFTRERQRVTTEEPAFQTLAKATIPTLAGLVTLPAGPVVAGVAGAGATGLNQLLGFEPKSLTQIGVAGLLPGAASLAVRGGLKASKLIGEFLAPAAVREAATEAATARIGLPATSLERVSAPAASEALFAATKNIGAVPITGIKTAVDDAIRAQQSMASPNIRSLTQLSNLSRKLATNPQLDYNNLLREVQQLRNEALAAEKGLRPDFNRAQILHEAREKILNELDVISPAAKVANRRYRLEESGQEIVNAMRNSTPNVAVRKLFETNSLVANTFGPEVKKDIYNLVDKITGLSEGAPAGFLLRLIQPLGNMLTSNTGRQFLRKTLTGPGPQTISRLNAAAQFGRALAALESPDELEGQ